MLILSNYTTGICTLDIDITVKDLNSINFDKMTISKEVIFFIFALVNL